jgi:hypothetical protein
MVVLIPWKPVVFVWLLLSAMLWFGYVGSSLLEGKNPFAPLYTLQEPHVRHSTPSVHQAYVRERRYRQSCKQKFQREKNKAPQHRWLSYDN